MEGGMEGGWKDGEGHTQVRDPSFFPTLSFFLFCRLLLLPARERKRVFVCVWW